MSNSNRTANVPVVGSNASAPSEDLILIDEVNFPLQNVYTPVENCCTTSSHSNINKVKDGVTNALLRLGEEQGLFSVKRISNAQKEQFCHNTYDMRDSFRKVVDYSHPDQTFTLTCFTLSGKKNLDICTKDAKKAFSTLDLGSSNILPYKYESSYDKLGNVVVSPPSKKDAFGTIIIGSQTPEVLAGILGGDSNALKFTWAPACGSNIVETNFTNANEANRSYLMKKRAVYCTETPLSFDFSKLILKGEDNNQSGPSDNFREILTRFRRQRVLEIYTGWLEVGHADEIISFIPYPKDQSKFGFKVLLASPKKFIEMWRSKAASEPANSSLCLFKKRLNLLTPDDTPGKKSYNSRDTNGLLFQRFLQAKYKVGLELQYRDCPIKIKDFDKPDKRPLIEFNLWLQSAILDKIKQQIIHELDIYEGDIIDIPILYIGPDELFSPLNATGRNWGLERKETNTDLNFIVKTFKALYENFGVYHISNNFINSLYSSNYIVSPILEDNLNSIEYIRAQVIRPGCIEKIYDVVDEWTTVKYQHGGLHCYTTETRDISRLAEVYPYREARGGRRKRSLTKKSRKNKVRRAKSTRTRKY